MKVDIGIKRPETSSRIVAQNENAIMEREGNPAKWTIYVRQPKKNMCLATSVESVAVRAFEHYSKTPDIQFKNGTN